LTWYILHSSEKQAIAIERMLAVAHEQAKQEFAVSTVDATRTASSRLCHQSLPVAACILWRLVQTKTLVGAVLVHQKRAYYSSRYGADGTRDLAF